MGALDAMRFGAFLSQLARPPASSLRAPVRRSEARTAAGLEYDLYEPHGPARACVVAVHGVTLNGRRDERLGHFARCAAQVGAACAVPHLRGLGALRWDAADVADLCGLFAEARAATGLVPGVVGFSFGGACALVAAARAGAGVRFVASFGAPWSLPRLFEEVLGSPEPAPGDEAHWDDYIYLHLVMAWRNAEALGVAALRGELESLLRRYCHPGAAREKRAFHERHLRRLDAIRADYERRDDAALRALSPAGNLRGLSGRVAIIHDSNDRLVPTHHARLIFDELPPENARRDLLVSPVVNHVDAGDLTRLRDLAKLWRMLSPVTGP